MSSLWTPEGEHPVGDHRSRTSGPDPSPPARADSAGGGDPGPTGGRAAAPSGARSPEAELDAEEEAALAEHLDELRRQLVSTPAEVVVANHAYGLFELAAIHLGQQPPRLDQARLAVDAMGAVVEGLAGRLGEAEESLVAALAQIRLAYVQISGSTRAPGSGGAAAPDSQPAADGAWTGAEEAGGE